MNENLPADIISDLRDAFEFFAKGGSHISRTDLDSIIHNFGFHRISAKLKKEELEDQDDKYYSRSGFDFDFLHKLVNRRWYRRDKGTDYGGEEGEFFDAFHVFDVNHRTHIKPVDLKRVFADHLDHPVTD